jgi:hypothetical protein
MPVQLNNTATSVITLKSGTSSSGKLVFTSANGTSGQALKTDGSGNLSWATLSSQPVTGFTTTESTGSFIASGGTTNQGVAVVSKGSGGFCIDLPDATTSGGNARGLLAVDLSPSRAAATQVAGGANAVLIGISSTASNTNTITTNGNHSNSSVDGIVIGGNSNSLTGPNGIMIGNSSTSTGSISMSGSTGPQAIVGNVNSGTSLWIASGKNSFILPQKGTSSPNYYPGGLRLASYLTQSHGFVEFGNITYTGQTTNYLTTDAGAPTASNEISVGSNAGGFYATVIARSDTGLSKIWRVSYYGSILTGANAPASTVNVEYSDTGTSAWSLTLSLGTNNAGRVAILATGDTGMTIRWWGHAQTIQF